MFISNFIKMHPSTVTWLRVGRSGIRIPVETRDFFLLWGLLSLLPRVKRPEFEVNHSSPSGAEVKNEWNCTSTLPVYLHGVVGRGAVCWGTTSLKVAGPIPSGVTGIFHWPNPSGRIMAPASTQPLLEINTKNISWVVKAGDNLTTFLCQLSRCFGSLNLLEPWRLVQV